MNAGKVVAGLMVVCALLVGVCYGDCQGDIVLMERSGPGSSWTSGSTSYRIIDVLVVNLGSCSIVSSIFPFYIVGVITQEWNLDADGNGGGNIVIFGSIPPNQVSPTLFLSLFVFVSLSISISLSISLSLSIPLSLYLSLSISLSLSLSLSVSVSLYLSLSLSVSISICVSLSLSLYLLPPLPSVSLNALSLFSPPLFSMSLFSFYFFLGIWTNYF